MNGTKAVQVINKATGEVASYEVAPTDIIPQGSGLARLFDAEVLASGMPIHEYYLQQLDESIREEMANIYYGLVPVQLKGSRFIGRDLPVYGMCIFQHGPYQGKDGFFHPEGYFQVWILTIDVDAKDEPFVVLQTSATAIAFHAVNIVNSRGWFLFEKGPVTYRVSAGPNGDLHIYNTEHDLKNRLKRKAVAK